MSDANERGLSPELLDQLGFGKQDLPPINPGKMTQVMRTAQAWLLGPSAFKPGDIVRQHEGLRTTIPQMREMPYIFLKYLDEVKEQLGPQYFRFDCVIGRADSDGDVMYFCAESARHELYPQADLDRLSAEASRKIN